MSLLSRLSFLGFSKGRRIHGQFNHETLMPRKFLTAEWRYLAMLNYEVDPALVEPLAPRGTSVDRHDGKTYLSMVGFLFRSARVMGIPIPGHVHFEEVNLRYYVRREVAPREYPEVRRGVSFVKEIVPRWAIALVARQAYNEKYVALPMRHELSGVDDGAAPQVAYEWRANDRWQRLAVVAEGEPQPLVPDSHEQFIAEHYWGYCAQRDGGTVEYQVEHPPWRVWSVSAAQLDCDVEAMYGPQYVEPLSGPPSSAFLAEGSAIAVYQPWRLPLPVES